MTLRSILTHPDPRLKKTASPVTEVTAAIVRLADDMLETMYDAPGIGLAAPQIGVMSRMVIMNPEVLWVSEDRNTYEEGCLSIPEQYGDVERAASVEMKWLGLNGQSHQQRFDGLWATCAQHELDHLNGKLFIDYLKPMRRQMITRKMQKLKREQARP